MTGPGADSGGALAMPAAPTSWLLAATLALVAGGCATSPQDGAAEPAPPVLAGLCAALDHSDDPAEAGRLFEDRAHAPLHELAGRVADRDRPTAGALLEAKRAVESDLRDPESTSDGLREHLEQLITATRDGLAALGSPSPSCPTRGTDR